MLISPSYYDKSPKTRDGSRLLYLKAVYLPSYLSCALMYYYKQVVGVVVGRDG